jgi:acyl-coenzyme A synthetase/AMP-(fatty) acid ligase
VAKGYWNNPEKTARHFRPLPGPSPDGNTTTLAVWSGDTVSRDEDGYFYFIGREDDMIKTSGYRVSPTDIEEVIHETGLVNDVVVFGVPHPVLGQAIVAVVQDSGHHAQTSAETGLVETLRQACNTLLPAFMVPAHIEIRPEIPKTPHGKLDRKHLSQTMQNLFSGNRVSSNEMASHPS